jgi:hypothetical protein
MNDQQSTLKEMFDEVFAGTPERIAPSIAMQEPNEILNIYQGEFELVDGVRRATFTGTIRYYWFPSNAVRFTGELLSDPGKVMKGDIMQPLQLYQQGLLLGEALVNRRTLGDKQEISGICPRAFLGDRSIAVSEILFSLPNFPDFLGTALRVPGQGGFFQGRLRFENEQYLILLDKTEDYDDRKRKLEESGGYLIQYGGKISSKKGAIRAEDLEELLYQFHIFLCFVGGKKSSLCFLKGIHEGESLWTDYTGYNNDLYGYVESWSRALSIFNLNPLWQRFTELWKVPENKHFLELVITWYIESNARGALVEGAIIKTQAALELLYNWLVVEQRQLIMGNDASGLAASNKIRLLLSQFNVNTAVPASLTSLHQFDEKSDGAEIIVWIRNCLVHGNKPKREDLVKVDLKVKNEALQLGLWWVELALLYILGYNEKYASRTRENKCRGKGDYVPWSIAPVGVKDDRTGEGDITDGESTKVDSTGSA